MKRGDYAKLDNVDNEEEESVVSPDSNVQEKNKNSISIRIKIPSEKEVVVSLPSNDNIYNLKICVEEATGTKVKCQRLVFAGRILSDKNTLGSYTIVNNSIVHLFPISEEQADANIASQQINNATTTTASSSGGAARLPRPTSAQEEMNQQRLNMGSFYSRLHVENPSLLLWRARVKIICIVCIFYFSLALMDEIPVIFGLESTKNMAPYGQIGEDNILFMPMIIFGVVSHVIGIVIAIHGIRATQTLLTQHALIFFKGFNFVIFLAAIETTIETYVSYKSATSRSKITDDARDSVILSLVLDIIVRICLWFLCWATAKSYLLLCRQREESRRTPRPNTAVAAVV